jgi:isoleucyl-tRNA synthetase
LLLSSPLLSGEDFSLIDKDVSDVARKLAMIWNVYDFFTMYAEVDGWESEAVDVAESGHFSSNPLDVWIVSRIHELRDGITEGMEKYNIPEAMSGILPFVDDLSNWFTRRSRRRFWKSEDDGDKADAYKTLHYALSFLAVLLAPFTPFLAEELWQKMVDADGSVHLLDWPEERTKDLGVLNKMARTREIIAEGLRQRMDKSDEYGQIKVRQPLAEMTYSGEELDEFYEKIIAEEVNVKNVVQGAEIFVNKVLTAELRAEGKAREMIRVVQAARKKAGLSVDDRIRLSISSYPAEFAEMIKAETLAVELSSAGNYAYDEIAAVEGENVTVSLEKV